MNLILRRQRSALCSSVIGYIVALALFIPFCAVAQQPAQSNTVVRGKVFDAATGKPLAFITVAFTGSHFGTSTRADGAFNLSATGAFTRVSFSFVGYQTVIRTIKANQVNELNIRLSSTQTQLKEVSVVSAGKQKYRNKGNPAVELIQQVIDHKDQNRMQSADYLQYDQYERIGLSLFNLSKKFVNGGFFSKYKFMLDSSQTVNGKKETILPVFFGEKISRHYYRKNPEKTINILQAEKGTNIIKFVDTAGVETYLNRLYGNNIDIYKNNIFVIVNEFLSPIADHAPNYYKFFITDTVTTATGKLAEISFTPRAKGDLLFEGKLLVTLDGRYAVEGCELNVNKQININFLRSLSIRLDFKPYPDGRYYLTQSNVRADFGILKNKGIAIFGERTVSYSAYKLNSPLSAGFYEGKSEQMAAKSTKPDTAVWNTMPLDSNMMQQNQVYARISRLENMASFKRLTWIASTLTTDYAKIGPLQAGPVGSLYSYDTQEGSRFQVGARTTPEFNKSIYLDGFTGYGTRDQQFKYSLSTMFSLNKVAPYRFPNDYFKLTYSYDVNLPGQNFQFNNSQAALKSFQTGNTDYWLYNRIFSASYVKDFESHFAYNVTFRTWNQQAAGALRFNLNDAPGTNVRDISTSELTVGLRYAPHEQLIQGSRDRRTIKSVYPILNLTLTQGLKGALGGDYNYTNITANIYKRFYLSQLGTTDVTLLGNYLLGKVPFPLLNIAPANQALAYNRNAYNKMYYLEFVSDHYVGLNFTQSFNGFFLNKVPLIKHLKWREYLSGKVLYGGLRDENNPAISNNLFTFPTGSKDSNGTYGLGSTPYVEAGVGIGNIFKLLRFDVIKRFNYLDHPGISAYGIKFSINPDL